MGAPAFVPHMRPRRMLRQLTESSRDQALPAHYPPHHPVIRARRRLALVLCRSGRGLTFSLLQDCARETSTVADFNSPHSDNSSQTALLLLKSTTAPLLIRPPKEDLP